jgi:hypothetical protein
MESSNYTDYGPVSATIKDSECNHELWQKKCSICKTILESDCQSNFEPGEPAKIIYSELSSLVTSYHLSARLYKVLPKLQTDLMWVHVLESDIVTLRIHKRKVPAGSLSIPAYSTSELCKLIYSVEKNAREIILSADIIRLAREPNKLGRFLLKELKQYEKEKKLKSSV